MECEEFGLLVSSLMAFQIDLEFCLEETSELKYFCFAALFREATLFLCVLYSFVLPL